MQECSEPVLLVAVKWAGQAGSRGDDEDEADGGSRQSTEHREVPPGHPG